MWANQTSRPLLSDAAFERRGRANGFCSVAAGMLVQSGPLGMSPRLQGRDAARRWASGPANTASLSASPSRYRFDDQHDFVGNQVLLGHTLNILGRHRFVTW